MKKMVGHLKVAKKKINSVDLDAHWYNDIPLIEEIEIIFENWGNAVVMIDDFQVPYDEGYGYDKYGNGKSFNLEFLDSVEHLNLAKFFPSISSKFESKYKRGCVVLVKSHEMTERLKSAQNLRYWE